MRLLGVDFGSVRIGLAAGSDDIRLPQPLKPLQASGALKQDAEAILKVASQEKAERIVVGLPLSQGEETKMSRICRMLGDHLSAMGADVRYVDESMTSYEAESEMRRLGAKGSEVRKAVDGEAACRILLRFMEENGADQG
ncbi:MAG: Holliday junction resolvase RuvX [Armatimonadetes bacterium]|nr:Holliday junction resolvase RuvX [Armatimonadota bacterium]